MIIELPELSRKIRILQKLAADNQIKRDGEEEYQEKHKLARTKQRSSNFNLYKSR